MGSCVRNVGASGVEYVDEVLDNASLQLVAFPVCELTAAV
jgi:hypothetical protein